MSNPPISPPPNQPTPNRSLRTNLIFYSVTLLTVLGLFQLTTAYGEANLKAPPNLNGRYLTDSTPPGCPPNSRLALTLQQSGRFLSAALELETSPTNAPAKPLQPQAFSLSGTWHQQVELTGNAPALATCQLPIATALQASFQPSTAQPGAAQPSTAQPGTAQPDTAQPSLSGQMQLNGQPWPFIAQRQEAAATTSEH